ncbi:MAG: DNA glycosylase AlkZ-like family protein [Polyangiaceae bacterium]
MAATKKPNGESTVAPERIRAFWAERQGLAGAMKGASASEVFARTGWARSVGGCNPYLALRDRAALSRASVDEAVAKLQIHELPSARGCTYVVPKDDYAIALRASQGHGDDASMAMATKFLGVTVKEIDRLCDRVLQLVAKTPLDPAGIKEAAGDAVRSLGPEGKKRGTTSTLPLALGRLQTHGLIRRVPTDGRLDQQRYRYVAWTPSPLGKKVLGDDEVAMELGRRFFRWTGPATVAQLAWWGGLGVKAARGVAAELKLATLEEGSDRYLFQDDKDALLAMTLPREPRISFVSSLDNIFHMRREVLPHLDRDDVERRVPGSEKKEHFGSLVDLPYHPIIDRGRVIGLWDWDGVSGKLAWRTFAKTPSVDKAVAKEGEALTEYVKRELGDARSFSLDSPESRVERIEELAKAKW